MIISRTETTGKVVTKLERISTLLDREGFDFKKSELIAAFRLLEDAGCGTYIEARHGKRARFEWTGVSSLDAAGVAKGEQGHEPQAASDDDITAVDNEEMTEHSFVLRPNVVVSFELPSDLTKSEAARLAAFVGVLSFDEDEDT